jgi:hypothetical protein
LADDQGRRGRSAAAERYGYISPHEGYVPPGTHRARPQGVTREWTEDDDRHHPLHKVYRKRIRGVRMRWFGSGVLLGVLAGVLLTLLVSALVVTTMPTVLQTFTGEPDVAVVIGETYLNREAARRVQGPNPMTFANLTLTGATLDLQPDNRMDLQTTFSADLLITSLNVRAGVKNQLSVQNGELVINMVGDPQIGSLNVPLELLPFNLDAELRTAIDKINNDLIIAEINQSLESGFGGSAFTIEGVTTNDSGMTVRLQHP